MLLANGVVGGLAFLSLILLTTVVVFGIKFVLDRNVLEAERQRREAAQKPESRKEAESGPAEARPLYVMKQPAPPRKKRARTPRPQYAVLPEGTVYQLEPVKEREKTAVS